MTTHPEDARKYGPTEWPEQLLREVYPSPGSEADLANREPAPSADAEPIAWEYKSVDGWKRISLKNYQILKGSSFELRPVFAATRAKPGEKDR